MIVVQRATHQSNLVVVWGDHHEVFDRQLAIHAVAVGPARAHHVGDGLGDERRFLR